MLQIEIITENVQLFCVLFDVVCGKIWCVCVIATHTKKEGAKTLKKVQ